MDVPHPRRVVFVHDWLTGMRGGEKCLEVLCRRWPEAPLLTLLHQPGRVSSAIEARPIQTSPLNRLPAVARYYRSLLPLMPAAAGRWRVPECDAVLSFSHCVAKSVLPPAGVPHVCYCFTPMRYAWHLRESYFAAGGRSLKARLAAPLLHWLRHWDRATAARVTHFVAISRTVQQRIQECYGRASEVIYPPVDTQFYCPAPIPREDYYLVVSAFAPYKRIDLALTACQQLRRKLVVIGTGQEENRLRHLAGSRVEFLGWQSDETIREHYRRCRALLFPGEEDFGIVPVEAMACGTPVLAFGAGGATESIVPHQARDEPTGIWFPEQTAASLAAAIAEFEKHQGDFSPTAARQQALRFRTSRYEQEMLSYLAKVADPTRQPTRRAA